MSTTQLTLSTLNLRDIGLDKAKYSPATGDKVANIQVPVIYGSGTKKRKGIYFEMYADENDTEPMQASNGVYVNVDDKTGQIKSRSMFLTLEGHALESMTALEERLKRLVVNNWDTVGLFQLYDDAGEAEKKKLKSKVRKDGEKMQIFADLEQYKNDKECEEYKAASERLYEMIPISLVRIPEEDSGYSHSTAASISLPNPEKKLPGTKFHLPIDDDKGKPIPVSLNKMIETGQVLIPAVSITALSITPTHGIKAYLNLNSAVIMKFLDKGHDSQSETRKKAKSRMTEDELALLKSNLISKTKKATKSDGGSDSESEPESGDEDSDEEKLGKKTAGGGKKKKPASLEEALGRNLAKPESKKKTPPPEAESEERGEGEEDNEEVDEQRKSPSPSREEKKSKKDKEKSASGDKKKSSSSRSR